jgi:glycosyltransferase involved in cell wall biosynthesis
MRVVWICEFSNAEIQNILHPGIITNELSPWITHLAKLFENETRIELHVVSPHNGILGYKHFTLYNIHYHFFNPNIYIYKWSLLDIFNFNIRTDYIYNKLFIRYIVKKIKPELIHLHGAENAYYSSSIIQFNKHYPVLVTVQGFISQTTDKVNKHIQKRIEVEKRILSTFKHFGYRTKTMGKDIRAFNPKAILHWHYYPIAEVKPIDIEKKYDIVFFARVCKDKGIDDLLEALLIIKRQLPDVKLCVIGGGSYNYNNLADQLGLSENIYWAGFLPTQAEVHIMASSSKISVLPTRHDIIPGTIIESMFLKLPVVACSVGGIPEINENEEYVTLVPKEDVAGLAEKILWLLTNPEVRKLKSEKAYKRAIEMFDNSKIPVDLLNAYNEVINDYLSFAK